MATGVAPGLQSRRGASRRPGWVRFPHVPAIPVTLASILLCVVPPGAVARPLAAQTPDPAPSGSEARPAADSLPPVSPFGALARSLVLPGWGQAAVDRPVRGAVYFTLEAASLFMVFKAQSKLAAARRAEPPRDDLVEARRAQREDWIVLAAFWAFMSGLDAWVSAHFWDFEAEVEPPEEGGMGISLRIGVPVGRP